jgi:hypothetical protein
VQRLQAEAGHPTNALGCIHLIEISSQPSPHHPTSTGAASTCPAGTIPVPRHHKAPCRHGSRVHHPLKLTFCALTIDSRRSLYIVPRPRQSMSKAPEHIPYPYLRPSKSPRCCAGDAPQTSNTERTLRFSKSLHSPAAYMRCRCSASFTDMQGRIWCGHCLTRAASGLVLAPRCFRVRDKTGPDTLNSPAGNVPITRMPNLEPVNNFARSYLLLVRSEKLCWGFYWCCLVIYPWRPNPLSPK